MTATQRTNKPASPAPNTSVSPVLLIVLSLIFGFVGGWLGATNQASDTVLVSNGQQVISSEGEVIADVAERVSPSVVSINVTSSEIARDFFFGDRVFQSQSEGSGIILSEEGLVVTNKHVIPEGVSELEIILSDGRRFDDIDVLGRDPFNDIAFLRINNADDLTPAVLGNSEAVRVGEKVIAIGNALGKFDTSVTSGIISGVSRPIIATDGAEAEQLQDLFQTDAAINPGNSGGPLLNAAGEVIAINTAVSGNGQNIGFAIPIDQVKPAITSVQQNGELIRPYLGVRYVLLSEETAVAYDVEQTVGALITAGSGQVAVLPDSPADKAGLRSGDIILEVEDTKLSLDDPLVTTVSRYQVGDEIGLKILRDGQEQTLKVTLEAAPDSF